MAMHQPAHSFLTLQLPLGQWQPSTLPCWNICEQVSFAFLVLPACMCHAPCPDSAAVGVQPTFLPSPLPLQLEPWWAQSQPTLPTPVPCPCAKTAAKVKLGQGEHRASLTLSETNSAFSSQRRHTDLCLPVAHPHANTITSTTTHRVASRAPLPS